MPFSTLRQLIFYYKVFREYTGNKLFVLCLIILVSGALDGFGLSLLLPILNFDHQSGALNAYSRIITDSLTRLGIPVHLSSLLVLMFLVFLVKGIFVFLQGAMTAKITTTLTKEQRLAFTRKYAEMSYKYYTNTAIGYLNNVITTEIDRAIAGFGKYTEVLAMMIYILIYSVVAFLLNWPMTLLVFAVCSFLFLLLRGLSHLAQRFSLLVSERNSEIQSLLIQMIYNFKYLKATASFRPLYHQLERKIEGHQDFSYKSATLATIPSAMVEPCAVLFLAGLIVYYVSWHGRSINEIFVLLLFFYKAFSRIFGFQVVWAKFCSVIGGVEVVRKTTEELNQHQEITGTKVLTDFRDRIEMKAVNFRYETRPIIQDVHMVIAKNATIGIVGESGAGKTTMFDLIAGLLIPQEGTISFDGQDYRSLELSSLRRMIGYVTQEPVIFNDTIANNISFWQCQASHAECQRRIELAAAQAYCLEFIRHTEQGFDTVIGDKGIKLSAGQRQRIAIARELFKQPQIMIFDEATSALDTESERLIQESINGMKGTLTMIIVAHRLSTVKNCDEICVLSQGRIIEQGTFAKLMADTSSRFYKMCNDQNM